MTVTSKPSSRNSRGATVVVAPLAVSIAMRKRAEPLRIRQRQARVRDVGVDDVGAIDRRQAAGRHLPARSAMIDSTCRSSVSVNFSPRPENTLMPLSSNGLCDALITSPASKPIARVM